MKPFKLATLLFPLLTLFTHISCASSSEDLNPIPDQALIPKATDTVDSAVEHAESVASEQTSAEPMSLEAKSFDCQKLEDACNADEKSNAHRCSLVQNNNQTIAEDDQISAHGDSRCFATAKLKAKLCEAKISQKLALIECKPDAIPPEECSAPLENCDVAIAQPTKCFAKDMDSTEIAWTNRPEAWGKNECEARNNLKRKACDKGVAPSEMKSIACEKEASPAVCPPLQQNCLGSITKGEAFTTQTARGKIYKKIEKLRF
ncbi:MAG: hypothetical protein EOP10_09440 [Proteobacteria bacterium]|nr:MAG: hypothetical protein EOP10_09440 [Pseudomonadota bacterium]